MESRPTLSVVVVEDDRSISDMVSTALRHDGHDVSCVSTAGDAVEALEDRCPDVVLLDLGLPDRDGLDVLRSIRGGRHDVGVICVSARADEVDRILGFELGADDYVTKPFSTRELVGRVRALGRRLRRPPEPGAERHDLGEVTVDEARQEVRLGGEVVPLTPLERDLLIHLARHRGLAQERGQLLAAVWGHDWLGASRTVDMHVAQLRRKLSPPLTISTVRGIGYRLE